MCTHNRQPTLPTPACIFRDSLTVFKGKLQNTRKPLQHLTTLRCGKHTVAFPCGLGMGKWPQPRGNEPQHQRPPHLWPAARRAPTASPHCSRCPRGTLRSCWSGSTDFCRASLRTWEAWQVEQTRASQCYLSYWAKTSQHANILGQSLKRTIINRGQRQCISEDWSELFTSTRTAVLTETARLRSLPQHRQAVRAALRAAPCVLPGACSHVTWRRGPIQPSLSGWLNSTERGTETAVYR